MIDEKILENYSKLVLKIGVNLQKGQGLCIACPIERKELARTLTKTAYEMGARIVRVRWEDEILDRINYLNAQTDELAKVPKWLILNREELLTENFCYVAVAAEAPTVFNGVSEKKLSAVMKARSKALKKFSDAIMENGIRWCVVSLPTEGWAKQVFPDSENAQELLLDEIIKTMRLDCADPLLEWEKHIDRLNGRAEYLNAQNFEYLRFSNGLGTNLKVGLAKNHVWLSAMETAKDGVNFVANMPTEEVFTAPHKDKIDGVIYSSMPLSYNGQLIENFSLTFKNGKVVKASAKQGEQTLKLLIDTDNGTHSLGEVALIGKNSPIAKSGVLFYNTLFDENASCHLALGKAYPTTVKNSQEVSKRELKSWGVNDSIEHVDFMIGTEDLSVTGIKHNGEEVAIFVDGEWIIDGNR